MLPRPLHRSQPITGHEQMTPPLRELDLQLPIRLFFRLSFDVDQSNILDLYIVTDYFTITITAVHRTVHAQLVMNFRPTTKASTVCSSKTGCVLRHVLFPSPNPETPCFSRQLVKAQPFDQSQTRNRPYPCYREQTVRGRTRSVPHIPIYPPTPTLTLKQLFIAQQTSPFLRQRPTELRLEGAT